MQAAKTVKKISPTMLSTSVTIPIKGKKNFRIKVARDMRIRLNPNIRTTSKEGIGVHEDSPLSSTQIFFVPIEQPVGSLCLIFSTVSPMTLEIAAVAQLAAPPTAFGIAVCNAVTGPAALGTRFSMADLMSGRGLGRSRWRRPMSNYYCLSTL